MTKPPDPELIDDENPEWTDEMFARARPAAEVLGPEFMAKWRGGRPKSADPKIPVSIRLDGAVVRHLRGKGGRWQTQVNDALRDLIKAGKL
jgi:uncharacterized protein (DUF4415 family)